MHRNGELGEKAERREGNGWDVRAVGHERALTNRGWTAGSGEKWMETGAVVLLSASPVPFLGL